MLQKQEEHLCKRKYSKKRIQLAKYQWCKMILLMLTLVFKMNQTDANSTVSILLSLHQSQAYKKIVIWKNQKNWGFSFQFLTRYYPKLKKYLK